MAVDVRFVSKMSGERFVHRTVVLVASRFRREGAVLVHAGQV
jgi:hypothetical protein